MPLLQVAKEYLALCIGGQRAAGTAFSIDAAIGAHPHMKVARAVVETGGQPALTHFEVRQQCEMLCRTCHGLMLPKHNNC